MDILSSSDIKSPMSKMILSFRRTFSQSWTWIERKMARLCDHCRRLHNGLYARTMDWTSLTDTNIVGISQLYFLTLWISSVVFAIVFCFFFFFFRCICSSSHTCSLLRSLFCSFLNALYGLILPVPSLFQLRKMKCFGICFASSNLSCCNLYPYNRTTYFCWQPLLACLMLCLTVYSHEGLLSLAPQQGWSFTPARLLFTVFSDGVCCSSLTMLCWGCTVLGGNGPSIMFSVFLHGQLWRCERSSRWLESIQGRVEVIGSMLSRTFCLRQMSTIVGCQH